MLLIRTRIGPSSIHGNGVFACETVAPGTMIWRFEPLFDRVISEEELSGLPFAFREYVDMYAYRSTDTEGRLVLSCDHAKFLNHSSDPNTEELPFASIARRQISFGDEITCDYGAFCVDWTGFDD
jgi:SET domain-containing protein